MTRYLAKPVALGHTSRGSVDHAMPLTGPVVTLCGVVGTDANPLIESGTTYELHHITCDRCRQALDARGEISENLPA